MAGCHSALRIGKGEGTLGSNVLMHAKLRANLEEPRARHRSLLLRPEIRGIVTNTLVLEGDDDETSMYRV